MLKQNKNLKPAALAAALALLTGSLAGCGGEKTSSSSSSAETTSASSSESSSQSSEFKAGDSFYAKEPLKLTMLYNDNPSYPISDNWTIWSEITKKTNVTLDLVVVPLSDFEQKRSLLISSGEAPQLMPKTYAGSEVQFIPSGVILPVSDYVDKMPNYMEKVEKWDMKNDLKQLMQKDGKYYLLSGLHEKPNANYSYLVREDIVKELGMQDPNTYDDLYALLKAMKAKYPDVYPLSDRYSGKNMLGIVASSFGVCAGWGKGDYKIFNWKTEKFEYAPTSQNYKDFLTYMNKLVKEGLLDPESFTQTDDQAIGKFSNGKSFIISTNTTHAQEMLKTMASTLGEGNFELKQIVPPIGPAGNYISGSRLENGIMINSSVAKDPRCDEIFHFVDWLWYSDEGQTFCKWGVEGVTYKTVNGTKQLMDDITFNGINPTGTKDLRKDFGFSNGTFTYGGSQELKYSLMNDREKTFQQSVFEKRELKEVDPPVLMDEDQREQANMIVTPLTDYVDQMTLEFILGTKSLEKDWDTFVSECKAKGCDDYINMCNQVYQETKDILNK